MLLAIHGFKQSGKDTLSDLLVREYGYQKVAFADKLKEVLHLIFNIPKEQLWGGDQEKQSLTPVRWADLEKIQRKDRSHETFLSVRELMQIFATEVCRDKIPGIWYRFLNYPPHQKIVISDLRFNNEAKHLKSLGAHIIKVQRPSAHSTAHASESGLDGHFIDYCLENDKSLNHFYERARELFQQLKLKKVL